MPENKIWNTALYIRLSREDGDKAESDSVVSQREMLQSFLAKNPDLKHYKTYIDEGFTGTNFNRPQFIQMMNDVSQDKVNCIVVKDLSRFGRNHIDTDNYLEIVFPLMKLRFIAINDQIDSYAKPKSTNNILVSVKNLLNDEYCRDISTKVKTVLDMYREKGYFIGSFASYGYLKDEKDHHKLVIDETAAEVVREIYNLFLEGYTIRSIASLLNDRGVLTPSAYKKMIGLKDNHVQDNRKVFWDCTLIKRMLTNQIYVGDMVQKKMEVISYKIKKQVAKKKEEYIIVKNTHEPIISREQFEKVQELLKRDTRVCKNKQQLDILSGYCKCEDCKRGMVKKHIHQPYKDYYYYICGSFKKYGKKVCTKHTIQVDKVKETVLKVIKAYGTIALNMDRFFDFISLAELNMKKTDHLQKQLQEQNKLKEKTKSIRDDLYPDFKKGILSEDMYLSLRDKYENDLKIIDSRIEEINDTINEIQNGLSAENKFISNFKKYSDITELNREMIVELINNIYILDNGNIQIDLKFYDDYLYAKQYMEETLKFQYRSKIQEYNIPGVAIC